jgi:hypothetical protein
LIVNFTYCFFAAIDQEAKLLASVSIVHEDEGSAHENGTGDKKNKDENVEHHSLVFTCGSYFFYELKIGFG